MNMNEATAICVEIALENIISKNMKIYEILDDEYTTKTQLISDAILKTLKKFPSVRVSVRNLKFYGDYLSDHLINTKYFVGRYQCINEARESK